MRNRHHRNKHKSKKQRSGPAARGSDLSSEPSSANVKVSVDQSAASSSFGPTDQLLDDTGGSSPNFDDDVIVRGFHDASALDEARKLLAGHESARSHAFLPTVRQSIISPNSLYAKAERYISQCLSPAARDQSASFNRQRSKDALHIHNENESTDDGRVDVTTKAVCKLIQEQTWPVDLDPDHLPVATCKCGQPACSRAYEVHRADEAEWAQLPLDRVDPDCNDIIFHVWVCASSQCDLFAPSWCSHQGVLTELLHAQAFGLEPDGVESGAVEVEKADLPLDEFWKYARTKFMVISPGAADVLVANIPRPDCQCGKPCVPVIEDETGWLFWKCATEECKAILWFEHQPSAADLDVGQIYSIGDFEGNLDRFTTLTMVFRWFGYSFSETFWRSLRSKMPNVAKTNRVTDQEDSARNSSESNDVSKYFPSGSYAMKKGMEYKWSENIIFH